MDSSEATLQMCKRIAEGDTNFEMTEGQPDILVDLTFEPDFKPSLFEIKESFKEIKVGKHKGIKGEEDTCLAIFCNFVIGGKHIILTGSRASGKTLCMMTVANTYCKNPTIMGKSSALGQITDDEVLNAASHFIIPELQKVTVETIEMLKDFGEGETFSYKSTGKKTIRIEPKAFITSKADENSFELGEELLSRLTSVRVNSSEDQNKAVVDFHLEQAANPFIKGNFDQMDIDKLRGYVLSLPNISEFNFVYPAGKYMRKAIPTFFPDSRRDVQKFLANTYAITLFHFWDRITIEKGQGRGKDKQKVLFVTPADIWINQKIFGKILRDSSLKINEVQFDIIRILDEHSKRSAMNPEMRIKELHRSLHHSGTNISPVLVSRYCESLYKETGFVIRNSDKRETSYEISEAYKNFTIKLDWQEIIDICANNVRQNFPEIAEDYINRFCKNPTANDPFTGEDIRILDGDTQKEIVVEVTKDKLSQFFQEEKKPPVITQPSSEEALVTEEIMVTEEPVVDVSPSLLPPIEWIKEHRNDKGFADEMDFVKEYSEEVLKNLKHAGEVFSPFNGLIQVL